MDFLTELDQLSDDEVFDKRYNNQNQGLNFKKQNLNYQGIKSIDTNDSFTKSGNSINDQFSDVNTSSTITYHTNDSSSATLVSTSVLSDKGRSIFRFQTFNRMQSRAFAHLYQNDHNCVISSPTGSGKTVLFELAILSLLNQQKNVTNLKVLYIAPTKALCLEREKDWSTKFTCFGLTVGVLTSDTSFIETDKVKKANIIITTPEKWDLMTRKWPDYIRLFEMIKILFVDEIHILKENRGSTLEVVVTRMKKICHTLRIIALSATVPNIGDVSKWIKLNSQSQMDAMTMVFGEDYRPIVLAKVVYGYKQNCNDFVFDAFLNGKLTEVLNEHSRNKPVLIFCPTRNSTISTAKFLSKKENHPEATLPLNQTIRDKELLGLAKTGIAFHHAGLSLEDRNSVENCFKSGKIKILCSTSTLSMGVNLPAYLVIIKGTKIWNNVSFEEYSELDILQMMGRAGRPQFESEGKAVIMTSSEKLQQYESLVKGNKKLESKLHLNLYENLTSEVFLGTITSLEDALTWLKHTFFYSRFHSNPSAYDEIPYIAHTDMDGRLLNYCESKIRELIDFRIIETHSGSYKTTVFGDSMTKHYIMFETMKMIIKSKKGMSVLDLLSLISKAKEFHDIRLKRTEKKLFKILNCSPIMKYPINAETKNKVIETSHEKICLLIQYELGGLEYPSDPDLIKLQHSFKQDKFTVLKHVSRLLKCSIDCFVEKNDFISLKHGLYLYRSVNSFGWEDNAVSLRQLSNVGLVSIRKFANHNIFSFKQIQELETSKLDNYLGLKPGQASKIKSQVDSLPRLSISSEFINYVISKSSNAVTVKINVTIGVEYKADKWNGKNLTVNVISGLSTGELVNFRRSHISKVPGTRSFSLEFPLFYQESIFESIISCEEIGSVGNFTTLELTKELPTYVYNELKQFKTKGDLSRVEEQDDDDDCFDNLLVEATAKQEHVDEDRQTSRVVLESGNLGCKHTCKDKTKYIHTQIICP